MRFSLALCICLKFSEAESQKIDNVEGVFTHQLFAFLPGKHVSLHE